MFSLAVSGSAVSVANLDSVANQFFLFLLAHKDGFWVSRGELLTVSDYVVFGDGCLSSDTAVRECLSIAWFVFHGELDSSTDDFTKKGWVRANALRKDWLSCRDL
jgi:hypothetical protein